MCPRLRRLQETQPPSLASRRRSHPQLQLSRLLFFRIFASLQVQTAELHRPRSAAATLTASSFKPGPWATTARQTEAWNRASTSGPAPIVPPGPLSPASCASSLRGPTADSSRVPTLRAFPSSNHLHSFDDFQKQVAELAVAIPYIVQQNRISSISAYQEADFAQSIVF